MLINEHTAISTSSVLLVPYKASHVPTYHEWMKDSEIQEATASEPLSLNEEYEMQRSWRGDHDKLTYIACLPLDHCVGEKERGKAVVSGRDDAPGRMLGDVNLFLSQADEDEEGCIGELELMIAPKDTRRKGYGRATILTFLHYIEMHLSDILAEYKHKKGVEKMSLLQLKVKIGSNNQKSIKLFESIGFIKVEEGANYFSEFELVLEGFLGEERTIGLLKKYRIEDYNEVSYSG